MVGVLPFPDAAYMGQLSRVESQFLSTEQAAACREAFTDLTRNYELYASQPQKVAALGESLRADFSGLSIAGCMDVGNTPLVDGVMASGPQVNEPSNSRTV